VQFNRSVTFILFSIFFLLAIIGVINTMLMAVIERTRELGMLMAVGMRPVQVVGLILAEAAGLAGASLVLGGAIGVPLLWYLQVHGLDFGGAIGEFSLAESWWVTSGTVGKIFLLTVKPRWGWRSLLLCLPSIPRCGLPAFDRRKRSERSSDVGCSPSGENRLAQSLAQSPGYPANCAGLGFGSCLAADLFGLARWPPRENGW
jgi:hypothetical protein